MAIVADVNCALLKFKKIVKKIKWKRLILVLTGTETLTFEYNYFKIRIETKTLEYKKEVPKLEPESKKPKVTKKYVVK